MGQRYRVRAVKCQLLVASFFVMVLGVSLTILTIITYYGKHFTVISEVSLERNLYKRTLLHRGVFFAGICLSILLIVAALLSVVATVRELESAMAAVFFCFGVVFCASVKATYWSITNGIVAEDAMMDVYDIVYEDVRSNSSNTRRQELHTIHKTFLCCGKKPPFGEASRIEKEMCQSEAVGTEKDCLEEIQNFLKKHMTFVSVLMTITIFFMVNICVLWYLPVFPLNQQKQKCKSSFMDGRIILQKWQHSASQKNPTLF
ncbi:tetraspanin-32 isoform X1 [Podarcis raffonei]|uniref:tetraspanin-32 isoform X1 n=1 Tax=Podarcis raffonei TaxID=65483 RepID=UPI00232998B4|nr:tetraspanin-32 isoform X1 [Podarcis raffonei]XP_053249818.1 tetraspanin-32 isoform X1 [Podarcis raffonei]XP_053249827.1 tetraspanin-32 isoform X1 [Podarcis raffonei]XP_053249838.1 tetraspanin-32 isoform X1 [Podarcis raffonei]